MTNRCSGGIAVTASEQARRACPRAQMRTASLSNKRPGAPPSPEHRHSSTLLHFAAVSSYFIACMCTRRLWLLYASPLFGLFESRNICFIRSRSRSPSGDLSRKPGSFITECGMSLRAGEAIPHANLPHFRLQLGFSSCPFAVSPPATGSATDHSDTCCSCNCVLEDRISRCPPLEAAAPLSRKCHHPTRFAHRACMFQNLHTTAVLHSARRMLTLSSLGLKLRSAPDGVLPLLRRRGTAAHLCGRRPRLPRRRAVLYRAVPSQDDGGTEAHGPAPRRTDGGKTARELLLPICAAGLRLAADAATHPGEPAR